VSTEPKIPWGAKGKKQESGICMTKGKEGYLSGDGGGQPQRHMSSLRFSHGDNLWKESLGERPASISSARVLRDL